MSPAELMRCVQELEDGAPGREVWRVGSADGAFCVEFDHSDSLTPQRDCEKWFDEHLAYCRSRGYTVQRARCYTQLEQTVRDVARRLKKAAGAADA